MSASLEENIWDTWVAGRGVVDSEPIDKYFQAFYWAFQTVTTVGYGDFSVNTTSEYILALLWMMIGTNLYAFTIGNVSSMIASLDAKEALLTNKIQTLKEYSDKYSLPKETQVRIKNFFENQAKTNGNDEWEKLYQ